MTARSWSLGEPIALPRLADDPALLARLRKLTLKDPPKGEYSYLADVLAGIGDPCWDECFALIARDGGLVVGWAMVESPLGLRHDGSKVAGEIALFVDPAWRRRGIGTALFKRAEAEARSRFPGDRIKAMWRPRVDKPPAG
jgi:GNAT superfamily N-acetyltransferase